MTLTLAKGVDGNKQGNFRWSTTFSAVALSAVRVAWHVRLTLNTSLQPDKRGQRDGQLRY